MRPGIATITTSSSRKDTTTAHTSQAHQQSEPQQTLADTGNGSCKGNLFEKDKHNYFLSSGWAHPDFAKDDMKAITVTHRPAETMGDRFAFNFLKFIRSTFDLVTGYKHPPPGKEADPAYRMTPEKWLERFVFLESIAGVPGMAGGMIRHLQSLRLLRRDRAWIETLLEEAYNERMHLLTFIQMTKPGWMMKLLLLGAQGVFFNTFFVSYLVNPKICHRFVGYLEEEAVVTYTRCIEDIERGFYPEWSKTPVPDIAQQYWHLPKSATLLDLLYYIRADEAKHREVNHTLGNLNQKVDRNPFALVCDESRPQPNKNIHVMKPEGWDRKDIAE
ncbi:hypothetical protein TRVA0_034S01090 [Trichomonascus vanleenenianus]|uniref:alternative oxidase n=1 Tax=Trichomonascus vanleenenianus TaxID=2268995 RepID=UPI003ECA1341